MRNVWLIIKREYLERVRTRAFLIFTVLMPMFIAGIVVIPSKLMTMKSGAVRNIVVAAPSLQLAQEIKQTLENPEKPAAQNTDDENTAPKFLVTTEQAGDESARDVLTAQVAQGKLDGFVWLTDSAVEKNKFVYVT